MIRVETEGSFWFIEEHEGFYIRTPKGESPREQGDWEEPQPGDALYDLEQHHMEGWHILNDYADTRDATFPFWARINARRYSRNSFPLLVIHLGSGAVATAPGAYVR